MDFASIDQMVGNLMKECRHLRQRLQEATLFPDTSAIQDYQAQNPEAASFWKDRFQNEALNASALRYEVRTLKGSYHHNPPKHPLFFIPNIRRILLIYRLLDRCYTFLGHGSYMR